MRQKRFRWIIVLAAFSLLGVIGIQLYWIQHALQLREEQFSAKVDLAMKSVVNRLLDSGREFYDDPNKYNKEHTEQVDVSEISGIRLLDSLLRVELGCLKIAQGYQYAVYDRVDALLITGNITQFTHELMFSPFQQSLVSVTGSDDHYLSLFFPSKKGSIWRGFFWWLLLSALFTLAVMLSFYYTVRAAWRQKRISEIKSDFINNMTHEFKTPIATISIAAEMLLREEVNSDPYKTIRYTHIILNENQRLQKQAEQVLQSAMLEKGSVSLSLKHTDLHELVKEALEMFQLRIKDRDGTIHLELNAQDPMLWIDPNLMIHAIGNLLDNAIKYSPDELLITIRTWKESGNLYLRIQDQGIGISKEDQKHIFKNLYRVSTGDRHDVKGFGIGLFYVHKIMEAHGGKIEVESVPGKVTKFTLILPAEKAVLQH